MQLSWLSVRRELSIGAADRDGAEVASGSESEKPDKHETVFEHVSAAKSERRSDNRLPHAREPRRSKEVHLQTEALAITRALLTRISHRTVNEDDENSNRRLKVPVHGSGQHLQLR